jgi:hypothetical protein
MRFISVSAAVVGLASVAHGAPTMPTIDEQVAEDAAAVVPSQWYRKCLIEHDGNEFYCSEKLSDILVKQRSGVKEMDEKVTGALVDLITANALARAAHNAGVLDTRDLEARAVPMSAIWAGCQFVIELYNTGRMIYGRWEGMRNKAMTNLNPRPMVAGQHRPQPQPVVIFDKRFLNWADHIYVENQLLRAYENVDMAKAVVPMLDPERNITVGKRSLSSSETWSYRAWDAIGALDVNVKDLISDLGTRIGAAVKNHFDGPVNTTPILDQDAVLNLNFAKTELKHVFIEATEDKGKFRAAMGEITPTVDQLTKNFKEIAEANERFATANGIPHVNHLDEFLALLME